MFYFLFFWGIFLLRDLIKLLVHLLHDYIVGGIRDKWPGWEKEKQKQKQFYL